MMDIQKAIEWQKAFQKTSSGMPKEVDEVCDFTIFAANFKQFKRDPITLEECEVGRY